MVESGTRNAALYIFFFFFFGCGGSLPLRWGLSLATASGLLLVSGTGFSTAVVCLAAEHWLQGHRSVLAAPGTGVVQ